MAFIDDLGLVEALLLLAAAVLTYVGLTGWWAMRKNDAKGLRNALKGGAIPVGGVGLVTLIIALVGEVTWPFPSSYHMAGYNIFFLDVMVLFGMVMVAYAVTAYYSIRFQYMGLFALVAGAVTIFYGYVGMTANPAFTKEPFDTFLLYAGFGVAGIAAFPAGIIVDLYLAAAEGNSNFWKSVASVHERMRLSMATRGVGSMVDVNNPDTVDKLTNIKYRIPWIAQILVLAFPFFMALAGIAALFFLGTTIPGHLGHGPGGAP